MKNFFEKIGISGAIADIVMVVFGVLIWFVATISPETSLKIIAIYMIITGIIRLIPI